MKAVVLAGGQEFGQSPLSRQAPRALWPLVDRPIIEHVLRALRSGGIGDMAISANGRTHDIAHRLGRHPASDITIHYSEDPLPRGAAGCIKDCEKWLENETFLVCNGASLLVDVDLDDLINEHRRSGAAITVGAEAADCNGVGEALSLKPTGLYVCEPLVFAHIRTRGYQDMKEQLIPRLMQAGLKVRAVPVSGRIITIRNEESYLNAMVDLLEDIDHRDLFTRHLPSKVPALWIDEAASIHPSARVVGPAYVGPGAIIEADAVVIGPAIVGPDCHIGQDAIVNESILWRGSRVGHGATVEHTVMAANSAVSPLAEARDAIVVDGDLSAAERQSLRGGSDGLMLCDLAPQSPWWRRLWSRMRPAAGQSA
jgi:NDP-sugar pyrophosphorylase family protein